MQCNVETGHCTVSTAKSPTKLELDGAVHRLYGEIANVLENLKLET